MEIDFFPGLDQTSETVIFLILALGAFFFAYIFFKWARRVRKSEAHMTVQELKSLKEKSLLTDEELKRVKSAMAKQYMEIQKEEERLRDEGNAKGLEALALEAEKLEAGELPKPSAPIKKTPLLPDDHVNVPPLVEKEKSNTTEPPKTQKALPKHLSAYASMNEFELEDAVNAGFISSEEMKEILQYQTDS